MPPKERRADAQYHGGADRRQTCEPGLRSHAPIIPYGTRDGGRRHRALRAGDAPRARSLRSRHGQCARRGGRARVFRGGPVARAGQRCVRQVPDRAAAHAHRIAAAPANRPTGAAGLPNPPGIFCGTRALRGRARAGAALPDRRAGSGPLRALGQLPARAEDSRHRHGLGRDRAGERRGVPARSGGCSRHLPRRASGMQAQRAPSGARGSGAGPQVRSLRRARGPSVRYHRQQSALCGARRDAHAAARVSSRTEDRPRLGCRWAGLGAGDLVRGASPSGRRRRFGRRSRQYRGRADARVSTPAVRLARYTPRAAAGFSYCRRQP